MELAASLAERLEAKGMSKAELARKLNMKPSQLTRILSASSNVTIETIARLEDAIGEDLIHIQIPSEKTMEKWNSQYHIESINVPIILTDFNLVNSMNYYYSISQHLSSILKVAEHPVKYGYSTPDCNVAMKAA